MMFRSGMCPNCDTVLKLDSTSEIVFCTRCGSQLNAEDAFVLFDLKEANGAADLNKLENYNMLIKSGKMFLQQKKHDLADACFRKILEMSPDDYSVWKLRALMWESKVVNEFNKSFYTYNREKKQLIENKEYLDVYKEYCDNAVKYCPTDMSEQLAEEYNDRIRDHFDIALKAYKKEKYSTMRIQMIAVLIFLILTAMILQACRN